MKAPAIFSRVLLILGLVGGLVYLAMISANDVADSFSRSVTDGWGRADLGGAYTLTAAVADFDVNGSAGTIAVPVAGTSRSAYLADVSAIAMDITFRVQTDKQAVGGGQMAYGMVRRVDVGSAYLVRLRFVTDGSIGVQAVREIDGIPALLGAEKIVPGVRHSANAPIRLHARVEGTNPTTIRLKAWADGQAEPANWQYGVTDAEPGLQAPGAVGLRVYLGPAATNAPVLFSFDDFHVTSVPER